MTTTKICSYCRKYKPADRHNFVGNKKGKLGLGSWCKSCFNLYQNARSLKLRTEATTTLPQRIVRNRLTEQDKKELLYKIALGGVE